MRIDDPHLGLDLRLSDPCLHRDPYSIYARLRAARPLIRCEQPFIGEAWLMTRYEQVSEVLKDAGRFNSNPRTATGKPGPFEGRFTPKILRTFARSMVSTDGLDHRRLRGLVSKAFTPARVDELGEHIEAIVAELLDDAMSAAASGGAVDLIAALALPLPLRIISELLGVDARERDRFHANVQCIMGIEGGWDIVRKSPGLFRLYRFFDALLKRKRAAPGDDLTSALIAVEEQGERLSAEELVGMIFLLLFAGHETTVNLIGNGTLALLDNPEQFERLRDDPALIPPAIEEMLRFDSPAHFASTRYVAEPCEIGGMKLERGAALLPCVAAANRDPQVFDEPDRFDVGRTPNRHLAFGLGVHFCVGAQLSRVEARLAFAALVERCPGMRLAIGHEQLRWRENSSGLRGLTALPLRLS
ncbi:Cytochrome P450 107B1 [Enhygromyxa salina]|uniref:Cytochrome P450 107B1 n=1 Tax=Enhygromyxa salina TaxID=215803 RepID=A0A2S9XB16_9BACT|nr:cytochrome P450 [Enhygromyxa salina]PRP90052.1 Cytochrome P450 107B1 [Enhygromyxa salina]